jgi:hypothetical protein
VFQGSRLLIQPRDIAAYDQDLGINAAIYYTFNSGEMKLRKDRPTSIHQIHTDIKHFPGLIFIYRSRLSFLEIKLSATAMQVARGRINLAPSHS